MLNAQHFGYEPAGTYQDAPLYHRRMYKEVKLSRLATFIFNFFPTKTCNFDV